MPKPRAKSRTKKPALRIRRAARKDAASIARLARALNAHQGDPTTHFTAAAIRRDGFGRSPQFTMLLAELDGKPVGYAMLYPCYETGWAARGMYVNDVYVAESARGQGVGRTLMAACAAEAERQGKTYIWWASKAWNRKAQAFYKKLGAIHEPVMAHAMVFGNFKKLAKEGRVRARRKY